MIDYVTVSKEINRIVHEKNVWQLIDGECYRMAPPSTMHQRIVFSLGWMIGDYIKKNEGSCEVFPAPFAVFLEDTDDTTQKWIMCIVITLICHIENPLYQIFSYLYNGFPLKWTCMILAVLLFRTSIQYRRQPFHTVLYISHRL